MFQAPLGALAAQAFFLGFPASAATRTGNVVKVADGDTVTVAVDFAVHIGLV